MTKNRAKSWKVIVIEKITLIIKINHNLKSTLTKKFFVIMKIDWDRQKVRPRS